MVSSVGTATAENWITNHPSQYEQLFDDGRAPASELGIALPLGGAALSAVARYTSHGGRALDEETRNVGIAQSVNTILEASSQGLFGFSNSIVGDSQFMPLEAFQEATAATINSWHRVCRLKGLPFPFDGMPTHTISPEEIEQDATQLVLMTAAAFAVVLRHHHAKSSTAMPRYALQGIKNFGPGFTNRFVEGENPYGLLSEEAARTSRVITESGRKNVLSRARAVPSIVSSLSKVAETLNAPSGEELAKELGWDVERTNAIFNPGKVRQLAVMRRGKSFMDTARRIRYLYDEVLTPDNIAERLNITPKQVKATFPPFYIEQVVFHNPDADPIDRLGDILTRTRELTNDSSLTYRLAVWMATFIPKEARARAALIQEERPNCPRGVSESLWAYAVALVPDGDEHKRNSYIAGKREYWNFLHTLSVTTGSDAYTSIDERYQDNRYAPEEVIFGDDSTSSLRDTVTHLLDNAGLSQNDKQELLDFFRDADVEPTPAIQALLERVRAQSC